MWKDRTKLLVGEDGIQKLENAKVVVVGIGGVGGYVCEMLVRAGIGSLTFVDFDDVDETNINRQIVANIETVGKKKTDVMKEILSKINPNCNLNNINAKIDSTNIEKIIGIVDFDIVVDAIDNVTDKVDLICFCKQKNIQIVSAMGAGNRVGVPNFKIMDIYKTSNDGLAKILRKKLRERGVEKLDVALSDEPAQKIDKKELSVGSISYYPAMCGCVISAYVIEKLLK